MIKLEELDRQIVQVFYISRKLTLNTNKKTWHMPSTEKAFFLTSMYCRPSPIGWKKAFDNIIVHQLQVI